MGDDRWHSIEEVPTATGWYECKAADDRWKGETRYRGFSSRDGQWWIPLSDGWLGWQATSPGEYYWRGPVADINGPSPAGDDPQG